ncbi:hypothetical protein NCAS_0I03000 [Naumovozyma castellii]|uniref:Uncharacterized protein n=1 Tax=Naumovozyma castellii TaxID=27288 RepID=G0VKD4_NAUCA|nr:hypothetical protein NCAS_0I03000 [Naumovozyma castellii CBS 4309]CCC71968.1 hypothetical protein NCAS_0I03000 [Naumovozyma castellii CBS 4309]
MLSFNKSSNRRRSFKQESLVSEDEEEERQSFIFNNFDEVEIDIFKKPSLFQRTDDELDLNILSEVSDDAREEGEEDEEQEEDDYAFAEVDNILSESKSPLESKTTSISSRNGNYEEEDLEVTLQLNSISSPSKENEQEFEPFNNWSISDLFDPSIRNSPTQEKRGTSVTSSQGRSRTKIRNSREPIINTLSKKQICFVRHFVSNLIKPSLAKQPNKAFPAKKYDDIPSVFHNKNLLFKCSLLLIRNLSNRTPVGINFPFKINSSTPLSTISLRTNSNSNSNSWFSWSLIPRVTGSET